MQEQTNRSDEGPTDPVRGVGRVRRAPQRINWVRHLHQWHWMSSAICLVCLILFAATGITLNNAQLLERQEPQVHRRSENVPAEILKRIALAAQENAERLPRDVDAWLQAGYGMKPYSQRLDWGSGELSISAPRPGGSASMRIDLTSGVAELERIDRGLIAYLNDLHKGRHAGPAWGWFLDVFAGAALLSALTGLLILVRQSSMRASIWPLVTLGAFVPALVIFLFVH